MKLHISLRRFITLPIALAVALLAVAAGVQPAKVHADAAGTGIPASIQSDLKGACSSGNTKTFWDLWFPATIPGGANTTVTLGGANFVCPGSAQPSQAPAKSGKFFSMSAKDVTTGATLSMSSTTISLGTTQLNQFSTAGAVNVNNVNIPTNSCHTINITYQVSAVYNGSTSTGSSQTVGFSICGSPPVPTGNASASCSAVSGSITDASYPNTALVYWAMLAAPIANNTGYPSIITPTTYTNNNVVMHSPDGGVSLKFQSDGNLVEYNNQNVAVWSSGTAGSNAGTFKFQSDGNLVIYPGPPASLGTAIWSSGTAGAGGAYLQLQDDGNLVLYNSSNTAVWSSGGFGKANGGGPAPFTTSTNGAYSFAPTTMAGYSAAQSQTVNLYSIDPSTGVMYQVASTTMPTCASGSAWQLSGTSAASVTSVSPGGQIRFTHNLIDNGPGSATNMCYGYLYFYSATIPTGSGPYAGETGSLSNCSSSFGPGNSSSQATETVSATPPAGANYFCGTEGFTPSNSSGSINGRSTPACAAIIYPSDACTTIPDLVTIPSPPTAGGTVVIKATVEADSMTTINQMHSQPDQFYVTVTIPSITLPNGDSTGALAAVWSATVLTSGTEGGGYGPVTFSSTSGSPSTLTMTTSPLNIPANYSGPITIGWGLGAPPPAAPTGFLPINCPQGPGGPGTTVNVTSSASQPYFSVTGGDIVAGSGFGDSCGSTTADIKSWNNGTSTTPNYSGAGSALGAFATGNITNFVSGLGLSGTQPGGGQAGLGLSFANTTNNIQPNFGGALGSANCVHDYYSDVLSASGTVDPNSTFDSTDIAAATPGGVTNFNANAAQASSYTLTVGSGTCNTSTCPNLTIPAGETLNVYVYGNVYIKNNILYGAYAAGTVPRLNLYVDGNIFIDANVTQLHGVYIAQRTAADIANDPTLPAAPTITTGIITTCSDSALATTEPYATCDAKQLTIVGSVATQGQLRLNRTYGTFPTTPAEIIQYSPEVWLNTPGGSTLKVKSYTSLPPVL